MNITTRQYTAVFLFALLIPGLGICAAKDSKEFIDTTSSCGLGVFKPWNKETISEPEMFEDMKKNVDYRVCLNSNGKFQNLESFINFSNRIHEKIEKFENSKKEINEEVDTQRKKQINEIVISELLFIMNCFKPINKNYINNNNNNISKINTLSTPPNNENITILGELLSHNQIHNSLIPLCIKLINNIDQSYMLKISNLYKNYCGDFFLISLNNNINYKNNLDLFNLLSINNNTILQNINNINSSSGCAPGSVWHGDPSFMCIPIP
jgi:hypothetical protein